MYFKQYIKQNIVPKQYPIDSAFTWPSYMYIGINCFILSKKVFISDNKSSVPGKDVFVEQQIIV